MTLLEAVKKMNPNVAEMMLRVAIMTGMVYVNGFMETRPDTLLLQDDVVTIWDDECHIVE